MVEFGGVSILSDRRTPLNVKNDQVETLFVLV